MTLLLAVSCTITEDNNDYEVSERSVFLGTWNCTETDGTSYTFTYPVTIKEDINDTTRVILENFGYIGYNEKPPYGIVSNSTIDIPSQKVCNDNSTNVSGYGILIDKNTMSWEYEILIGGDKLNYNATFKRK